MRVLYVFRNLAIWGGIERILVDKMNYLVSVYGYEVFMLTANQGIHPVPYKLVEGVHLEDLNMRFHDQYKYKGIHRLYVQFYKLWLFRKRLKSKIAQISPDVIVCVADDYHVSVAKTKGKIPLLIEAHNNCTFFHQEGLLKKLIFRYQRSFISTAHVLVTLSQRDADDWRHLTENVRVIPNSVHLNSTGKYSDNNNRRVIFVGRLVEQKCVFDIIEIWEKVFPKFPEWRLDIYGEGECQQRLEDMLMKKKMNVFIHQPTDKIFDCYRESDLLILTSEYEPFGLVIPESMSCGLPVVSYRSPYGPESIITDGYDGFLVPLGDKLLFAERLYQLMGNLELRRKMGGHAIVSSQRYSAERIMPMWNNLFKELVNSK